MTAIILHKYHVEYLLIFLIDFGINLIFYNIITLAINIFSYMLCCTKKKYFIKKNI